MKAIITSLLLMPLALVTAFSANASMAKPHRAKTAAKTAPKSDQSAADEENDSKAEEKGKTPTTGATPKTEKAHESSERDGKDHDKKEHAHSAEGKNREAKKSETARKLEQSVTCEALPQKTEKELWKLSDCFFKMGDNKRAINSLHELTRRNAKDLEAFFMASYLYWLEGRAAGGTDERKHELDALEELQRARVANPSHWQVDTEVGDFYLLRLNKPEKAYTEFQLARKHGDGDYSRNVPKADNGHRAGIEDRIARVAEMLDNKGEAVEASCRALFFDPDDSTAEKRVKKLFGSCVRKEVKNPKKTAEEKEKEAVE